TGSAHTALAAALEGAGIAAGRAPLRVVSRHPRDVSRVPAGRVRPAVAEETPAGTPYARARSPGCRDPVSVAVLRVAPVRLHRDVHVRGRHAARRTARAGEERRIAAEDAGRYRDALGVMPPGGLPEAFLEGGAEALEQLVLRYARGRGPFTTAEANARFGIDVESVLHDLERRDKLVRGELRPGGTQREWCEPDVLRRLRRASLAALRKEVEPTEQAAFGRFLPNWH